MESPTPASFLRLPAEIRLMIYELLILPSYAAALEDPNPYTLHISTINPLYTSGPLPLYRTIYYTHPPPRPLPYHCTLPTTWTVTPSTSSAHLSKTLPSLLPLCRQVYAEATTVLYSAYTLSFGTSIDAIAPFFGDLSPAGKRAVRKLQMSKRALPWIGGSGEADWTAACACLAVLTNPSLDEDAKLQEPELQLTHFALTVETATQPTYPVSWERVEAASAAEFAEMVQARREGEALTPQTDMLWAEEMRAVRVASGGEVKVEGVAASVARVRSQDIGFWVKLSKSVEGGFAEWMRDGILRRGVEQRVPWAVRVR